MYVIIYSYPYLLPDGTSIKEEYELYDEHGFVSIHYTNPDESLPLKVVMD